jgi:hypothetical protein
MLIIHEDMTLASFTLTGLEQTTMKEEKRAGRKNRRWRKTG